MVIVQNPTLAPAIEKSDYEPKTPEADASIDADTVNDATAFLETFFKLYPTATEKELAYYVREVNLLLVLILKVQKKEHNMTQKK